MKRTTVLFILLLVITAGVLFCVGMWSWQQTTPYLISTLVLFAMQITLFVFLIKGNKKNENKVSALTVEFTETLEGTKVIFFAIYCKIKHLSQRRGNILDAYFELFSEADEKVILSLSEKEREQSERLLDVFALPLKSLVHIHHKKIILSKELYEGLKEYPAYRNFLSANTFFPTE